MSNENLANYFDAVIKKDDAAAFDAFSMYIEAKAKSMYKDMVEEAEKPVRLQGNDILVNGKKVGTIHHDTDKEDGISYTADGSDKKSKHDSLDHLFAHLAKEHKLEEGSELHVLSTRKKGTDKWGEQFSGTRKECADEWRDTKHDWAGHEHKIHKHEEPVKESAPDGEFKGHKNVDALKLTPQGSHEDKVGKDEAGKDHASGEKRKKQSRAQVDKVTKPEHKIDWKA